MLPASYTRPTGASRSENSTEGSAPRDSPAGALANLKPRTIKGMASSILNTPRLSLTPLKVQDAREMAEVLAHPAIYFYIDDEPLDKDRLSQKYLTQTSHWDDENTKWRNWVVRLKPTQCAIGYIQATITADECILAWVINPEWQSNGYATEGAKEVIEATYKELSITLFTSKIDRLNNASKKVAEHLGMSIIQKNANADDHWGLQFIPPKPSFIQ